jgi:hypothetical protein
MDIVRPYEIRDKENKKSTVRCDEMGLDAMRDMRGPCQCIVLYIYMIQEVTGLRCLCPINGGHTRKSVT